MTTIRASHNFAHESGSYATGRTYTVADDLAAEWIAAGLAVEVVELEQPVVETTTHGDAVHTFAPIGPPKVVAKPQAKKSEAR